MPRPTAAQKKPFVDLGNKRTCGFTVVALLILVIGLFASYYLRPDTVDDLPYANEALTEYRSWVAVGDLVKGIKVSPSICEDSRSICVRADEDIAVGDKIASYRSESLFSLHQSQYSKHMEVIVKLVTSTNTPVDEFALLALHLMVERFVTGPDSQYRPYLNTLPAKFGSSLYWEAETLEMVKGTSLHTLTQSNIVNIRRTYARFFPELSEKLPDMFPEDACSFRSFLWAYAIVQSRAMLIPDGHHPYNSQFKNIGLLPLMDIAKHVSPGPSFETDYAKLKSELKVYPDRFHWIATSPVSRSQTVEIELLSGTKDDITHLIHRYGVYTPDLHKASYLFELAGDVDELQEKNAAHKHADVVDKYGRTHPLTFLQDAVPAGACALMRNLLAPKGTSIGDLSKPLANPAAEYEVQSTLLELIQGAQREIAGGYISEDEELLAGDSLSGQERTAVSYRLELKKILAHHIRQLQKVTDLLKTEVGKLQAKAKGGQQKRRAASEEEDADGEADFDI